MAPTSTNVDAFGRVVIPKRTRARYGLTRGAVLDIEESPSGILLRPAGPEAPVRSKGGVLVLTAEATDDLAESVRRDREERVRHLAAGRGR